MGDYASSGSGSGVNSAVWDESVSAAYAEYGVDSECCVYEVVYVGDVVVVDTV